MLLSSFALISLVWIQAVSAASIPTFRYARLEEHDSPEHHAQRTFVSYEHLRDGHFEPDRGLTPMREGYLKDELYRRRTIYKGIPIYFSGPNGYNLQQLQRAFADFGKIHVVPSQSGHPALTIRKGLWGRTIVRQASSGASSRAEEIAAVRSTFGDVAAITAYGQKLKPVPSKRVLVFKVKHPPPDWNEVWGSFSFDNTIRLRAARDLLNARRFITFSTPDARDLLGIRLLEDGSQDVQWLEKEDPIFTPLHS